MIIFIRPVYWASESICSNEADVLQAIQVHFPRSAC